MGDEISFSAAKKLLFFFLFVFYCFCCSNIISSFTSTYFFFFRSTKKYHIFGRREAFLVSQRTSLSLLGSKINIIISKITQKRFRVSFFAPFERRNLCVSFNFARETSITTSTQETIVGNGVCSEFNCSRQCTALCPIRSGTANHLHKFSAPTCTASYNSKIIT